MNRIGVKKLVDNAVLPTRSTERAACYDLTAHRIEMIGENRAKIYFGIACDIPEGYKLCIVPRSSFCLKGWIQANSPGQVDEDYKGQLMMFVEAIPIGVSDASWADEDPRYELDYEPLPYEAGDRCAQMFLQVVEPSELVEVDDIGVSERGAGGFGSTGK